MKIRTTLAVTVFVWMSISLSSYARDDAKPTVAYGTHACKDLTALDYEHVGSTTYYLKGHYDALHNVWVNYTSQNKPGVAVTKESIPIQDIHAYCLKNPRDTVIKVMSKREHWDWVKPT